MKFCQPHWDALRAAIDERGIGHLVASSREAAMQRAIEEVEGRETTATYDPLMTAHWMICGRALDMGGGVFIVSCPLCELNVQVEKLEGAPHVPEPASIWIQQSADAVRDECLSKGLRPILIR